MLLLLLACAPPAATDSDGALVTDGGIYALELVATPVPYVAGEPATLQLTVSHAGAPVDDATLTLTPWMPAMGHGLAENPSPEALGEGQFTASWTFPMSGDWDIDIGLDSALGPDSATVTYAVF